MLLNDVSSDRARWRWHHVVGLVLYVVVFLASRAWSPELRRDELHFWPTSLTFSRSLVPSLEQLADYGELNTPLAFLFFGWTEWLTGLGVAGARILNCIVSLAVLFTILGRRGGAAHAASLAAVGLLAFPYFLGASVHAYPDIIAAALALAGTACYTRGRHGVAALAFVLGISTRQYIVAFPVACLAHLVLVHGKRAGYATLAYLLATASLFAWFGLFGGYAPASALAREMPATSSLLYFRPQHALYFLACVGAYYVAIEWALFTRSRVRGMLSSSDRRIATFVAAAVLVAFLTFPPLGNVRYGIEEMGFLDVAARATLPDVGRLVLFGTLAGAACWRFRRVSLASLLLLANAGLMIKAHIAWDKYALPLLVVLWYLRSGPQEGGSGQADGVHGATRCQE